MPEFAGGEKTHGSAFPLIKVWNPPFCMWSAVQASTSVGVGVAEVVVVDDVVGTEVVVAVEDLEVEVVKVVEVGVIKQEHPDDTLDAG